MSLSTNTPIDMSNPPAVQVNISTNPETPRRKLSPNDKTLTTRRKRLLEAHASSPQFKSNPKNNRSSSPVSTESHNTSGTSEKKHPLKIHRISNIQTTIELMKVHQTKKVLASSTVLVLVMTISTI